MSEIKYTFIIPHHNTPDLLNRCIASIPIRSDVEVIVVDDNSDDDKRPSVKRADVRVLYVSSEESRGAGHARNIGIENAHGKWILFSDADDYYADNMLDIIDSKIENNIDVLYYDIFGKDKRAAMYQEYFSTYLRTSDDKHVRFHIWTPWNKVISYKLIIDNQLRFEEVPVGNDAIFALNVSKVATKYEIISDKLYCLTDNEGSITHKKTTFDRLYAYMKVQMKINRFFEPMGLDVKFGHRLFSIGGIKRIYKDYGLVKAFKYLMYVSFHYGLWHSYTFNKKMKK